jgi:hypothetical protein
MYKKYCAHYADALECLSESKETSAKFSNFLKVKEGPKKCPS